MSQAQEVICLTTEQIDTVINNMFTILKLSNKKEIFRGKPVFSRENEEKYKLPHITKFANNYVVYEGKLESDAYMYIITIEADKFDKLNISACSWFYHLFEQNIDKSSLRPQVYICPAFVVTDTMLLHLPLNVIPCAYRFMSLAEAYPLIGSKNHLYGLTFDYKIVPYEESYNKRKYPIIFNSDIIVKILNALDGELIMCRRIMYDTSPYGEYTIRQVQSTMTDINVIDLSGICYPEDY